MKKCVILFSLFLITFSLVPICAQKPVSPIYVDDHGTMRWSENGTEATFFGTNYTLPFAHAYRAVGRVGVDRKEAIKRDVYHFARLGLNAYRIHLWDQELTDIDGNLLRDNDHLDLMDFLVAELQRRGIYVLITFQTDFNNGYPEIGNSGGYSSRFTRSTVLTEPMSIVAQQRYITQLLNHKNPYTKQLWKNDNTIIGFELNNEPQHRGSKKEVSSYISTLVTTVRKTGCKKPLFYNAAESSTYAEVFCTAPVQGLTFQWYPENLVAGRTRTENFLPYVDRYVIPFADKKGFASKARISYEFDAADVMCSYMYPAMARAFREAGFQWMTQFAYDPIDIASFNTEYQTHFVNLAYTPHKALSLMIAAEAARQLPRGKSFGTFPQDTIFGSVRVSYKQNLSELNDGRKFYYSNTTNTTPIDPNVLESVAGCGSSPIIRYDGTGAYFFDKLENGVWRLEVMPNAISISDPFAKPSLKKETTKTFNLSCTMAINIANLTSSFSVKGLNQGNNMIAIVDNGIIQNLRPGVYLLTKNGTKSSKKWTAETQFHNIRLGEYVAPKSESCSLYYVVNHSASLAVRGQSLKINIEVAGLDMPDSVIVMKDDVSMWKQHNQHVRLVRQQGFTYVGELSVPNDEDVNKIRYNVVVCHNGKQQTFPGGVSGKPTDWDYINTEYYETWCMTNGGAIILYSPNSANRFETYALPKGYVKEKNMIDSLPGGIPTSKFVAIDGKGSTFFLRKELSTQLKDVSLRDYKALYIRMKDRVEGFSAGFITDDGIAYMATDGTFKDGILRIPFSSLRQIDTPLLPHGYPGFQPLYFHTDTVVPFSGQIEAFQMAFTDREIEFGTIWIDTK